MKPSLNAINQALKTLTGKKDVRKLLNIPRTFTTTNRYVTETYNILPWDKRTEEEKIAAIEKAKAILAKTQKNH